jgi:hypothetical protein
MKTFNNKDKTIITKELSNIAPTEKDAEELLNYLVYEHNLLNEMHQDYFNNGSIDKFKSSDNYNKLVSVRNDLTERFKIYIKYYYKNKVRDNNINPQEVLTDKYGKVTNMYSLDGQFIKSFPSTNAAAAYMIENNLTNCKHTTIKQHITEVCTGRRKTAAKFKWQYG